MWLDNLKELKKEKGMTTKQLAERSNLPEKTVTRILSGNTANPYIDTLDRLATALGCSIGDILAGTKAVVGNESLCELQENVEVVTAEKETVEAEKDLVLAENKSLKVENASLKDQNKALSSKIELLEMKLAHKEEMLAVHSIYLGFIKKQQGDDK